MTILENSTSVEDTQPIRKLIESLKSEDTAKIRLDETPDHILKPEDRVNLRRQIAENIKETENYGILKSTFVRYFPDTPEAAPIVASMGAKEETAVKGLNAVGNELIFCPQDPSEWLSLSNKDRNEKIRTEIIPKVKNIVYVLHGWDGEQGFFEPYSGILLSPTEETGDETEQLTSEVGFTPGIEINKKAGNKEEGMAMMSELTQKIRSIPEDTLIVSLSYAGSLYGVDAKQSGEITEDDIETQILEAIEKVNMEINEAKLAYFETEEYKAQKKKLVEEVHKSLIVHQKTALQSEDFSKKFDDLTAMIDAERLVATGRYADHHTSLVIGHSMGGWRASNIWKKAVVGEPASDTYAQVYRLNADAENSRRCDRAKARIEKINADLFAAEYFLPEEMEDDKLAWEHYFKALGGLTHKQFLTEFTNAVGQSEKVSEAHNITPADIKTRLPNLHVQTWMEVTFGPEATNLPDWATDIDQQIKGSSVPLDQDPLIQLSNLLRGDVRGAELFIGDKAGIVDGLITKYVGDAIPDALQAYQTYKAGFLRDENTVRLASRLLRKMPAIFTDQDLKKITHEHLLRFSGFAGGQDPTVSGAHDMAYGALLGKSIDAGANYNPIRLLPASGHHPRTDEMAPIKAGFLASIVKSDTKRSERNQAVRKDIKNWAIAAISK